MLKELILTDKTPAGRMKASENSFADWGKEWQKRALSIKTNHARSQQKQEKEGGKFVGDVFSAEAERRGQLLSAKNCWEVEY